MPHLSPWLAAGHALVRAAHLDGWRLHTPDGDLLAVDPSTLPADLDSREVATMTPPRAFRDAGFTRSSSGPTPSVPALIGKRLAPDGVDLTDVDRHGRADGLWRMAGAADRQVVVLRYADHPADDTFFDTRILDRVQVPPGTATILRVSVEGGHAYLEPPFVPDGSSGAGPATHAMVRKRRLSCSGWPDELRALWSRDAVVGASLVDETSAGLLADVVAATVRSIRARSGDAGRILRRVNLRTRCVTDHPMLPIPEPANGRVP